MGTLRLLLIIIIDVDDDEVYLSVDNKSPRNFFINKWLK